LWWSKRKILTILVFGKNCVYFCCMLLILIQNLQTFHLLYDVISSLKQCPTWNFLKLVTVALRMLRHGKNETSEDSVHNVQRRYMRFLPETNVVNNPNCSCLHYKIKSNIVLFLHCTVPTLLYYSHLQHPTS